VDHRHFRERHPRRGGSCPVDRRHRSAIASQARLPLWGLLGRSPGTRLAAASRCPARRTLARGSTGTRLAVAAWRATRRVDGPARLGAPTERRSTNCATVSMGPAAQRRPATAGLARHPSASTGAARNRGRCPTSECPLVRRSGRRPEARPARPVGLASTERQAAEPTELNLSRPATSGPRPRR
jgi:hypothetical protein